MFSDIGLQPRAPALDSVLIKDAAVAARFRTLHGDTFRTIRDYYVTVRDLVEIVDLCDLTPAFRGAEE